jgi:alpha-D-ribose 1-methylphosphonate 5-triphosphate diphosphatase
LSSVDAWSEGLVDIFCSDYHFPTLLAGVIKLMEMHVSPSQAINTVSLNPARLLGMDQELGSIEVGKKADLVAFQPKGSFGLVETVWVNGEKRFFAGR